MSVYSGFATRKQESFYNKLLEKLLQILTRKILSTIPYNQIASILEDSDEFNIHNMRQDNDENEKQKLFESNQQIISKSNDRTTSGNYNTEQNSQLNKLGQKYMKFDDKKWAKQLVMIYKHMNLLEKNKYLEPALSFQIIPLVKYCINQYKLKVKSVSSQNEMDNSDILENTQPELINMQDENKSQDKKVLLTISEKQSPPTAHKKQKLLDLSNSNSSKKYNQKIDNSYDQRQLKQAKSISNDYQQSSISLRSNVNLRNRRNIIKQQNSSNFRQRPHTSVNRTINAKTQYKNEFSVSNQEQKDLQPNLEHIQFFTRSELNKSQLDQNDSLISHLIQPSSQVSQNSYYKQPQPQNPLKYKQRKNSKSAMRSGGRPHSQIDSYSSQNNNGLNDLKKLNYLIYNPQLNIINNIYNTQLVPKNQKVQQNSNNLLQINNINYNNLARSVNTRNINNDGLFKDRKSSNIHQAQNIISEETYQSLNSTYKQQLKSVMKSKVPYSGQQAIPQHNQNLDQQRDKIKGFQKQSTSPFMKRLKEKTKPNQNQIIQQNLIQNHQNSFNNSFVKSNQPQNQQLQPQQIDIDKQQRNDSYMKHIQQMIDYSQIVREKSKSRQNSQDQSKKQSAIASPNKSQTQKRYTIQNYQKMGERNIREKEINDNDNYIPINSQRSYFTQQNQNMK